MLALERGEKVLTPPEVWFQGRGDILHDYKDEEECFPGDEPQRFAAITARPAARSRWNTSTPNDMPATRQTCRRPATCSSGWWRSLATTLAQGHGCPPTEHKDRFWDGRISSLPLTSQLLKEEACDGVWV